MERLRATIEEVKGEKDKTSYKVMLGNHEIGTSKTGFDAQFHLNAINKALDEAYEQGRRDYDEGN